MTDGTAGIDPTAAPVATICLDCEAADGWWLHLRRCAQCGHIGCCDDSPAQHARAHFEGTEHPVIQSFEPGESWFWDYAHEQYVHGPALAEPTSRPDDQPSPGPTSRVPENWRELLRLHS
ncbi:UBP-type zinc finger domain-containing protein [Mycetocola zhadangensis]|uniref:UBP-type zinc finger domain-containing protein n=1 Tax=Mycetocola zhadangensis TaxID=1164595 RepID=UPI003A4DFF69